MQITEAARCLNNADFKLALVQTGAGRDCQIAAVPGRLAYRRKSCLIFNTVDFKCERTRVPASEMTQAGKPKRAPPDSFFERRLHASHDRSVQTDSSHQ